jgi:hypothetical protein
MSFISLFSVESLKSKQVRLLLLFITWSNCRVWPCASVNTSHCCSLVTGSLYPEQNSVEQLGRAAYYIDGELLSLFLIECS